MVTLQVFGVNDAPQANSDLVVEENENLSFNVLVNDSDPDAGDVLAVTQLTGGSLPAGSFIVGTLGGRFARITLQADGDVTFETLGNFDNLVAEMHTIKTAGNSLNDPAHADH